VTAPQSRRMCCAFNAPSAPFAAIDFIAARSVLG
jgi:hypothetical protein